MSMVLWLHFITKGFTLGKKNKVITVHMQMPFEKTDHPISLTLFGLSRFKLNNR